jgi:hypothetical protein
LIPVITRYNHEIAEELIDNINTVRRRDIAYAQMIQVYVRTKKDQIDINFVEKILNKITFNHYKDWVTVQILKEISNQNPSFNKLNYYYEDLKRIVYSINSTIGKAYAFSYYFVIMGKFRDNKILETLSSSIKDSLANIDSLQQKMITGFRISKVLATVNKKLATEIFSLTKANQSIISFSDNRINEMYIGLCKLLINAVPEIIKSHNFDEKIEFIKNLFFSIPSKYDQIMLLSALALKCYFVGVEKYHRSFSEDCIRILENCEDKELFDNCLVAATPTLFLYEREILFEKLDQLPIELRNTALFDTIQVIISKRLPEEVVDLSSLNGKIDYREALQVCDLLEKMTDDSLIYGAISCLVNILTEPVGVNRIRGKLGFEKHLLSIAERLAKIIDQKLPDPINIKHEGYRIISEAELVKLKHACGNLRANKRWDSLVPEWRDLKQRSSKISNDADRTFVFANLAETYFNVDQGISNVFSHEAEKSLEAISNYIDRIERYRVVARTYHRTMNSSVAKDLLMKAMDHLKGYNYDDRDQMLSNIIEVAHNIDPNLATTLASEIDNPIESYHVNVDIEALNLHTNPARVLSKSSNIEDVIKNVFKRLLKSLRSGKGTVQSDEILANYIIKSLGQDFDTVQLGTQWFIENTILANKNSSRNSQLDDLFSRMLNMIRMINNLGTLLIQNEAAVSQNESSIYQIIHPKDTYLFEVGEREKAIRFIEDWLQKNVTEYVKIYDPYFEEEFIFLLKNMPGNCRVKIITSQCQSKVEQQDLSRK